MRLLSYAVYGLWAILAGAGLPVQAGINIQLRRLIGDPIRASFVQFTVGSLFLLLLTLAVRTPWPALSSLTRGPAWAWSGGMLGALYVISVIVLVPRLGAAVTFALVVAGQMGISLAMDQFGLFGLTPTQLTPVRIAGSCLLIAGVVLLRR
ncbi:MAG: DMT family transporter [Vulcanimicrobiaceae bacterium]